MHVVDRESAPATMKAPRGLKSTGTVTVRAAATATATATATLRARKLTGMVTRRVRAQEVKEEENNSGQDSVVASQCHGVCLCCSLRGSLMRRELRARDTRAPGTTARTKRTTARTVKTAKKSRLSGSGDRGQGEVLRCSVMARVIHCAATTRSARALSGNGGRLHRIYSVTPARQGRR